MDRKMELDHLAIAEKAVVEGDRHIAREEQMIADLERGGHDTKLAFETLATLRRMQAAHIAHRDLLLKMLQQGNSADAIFRPGHYDNASGPAKGTDKR
ncbi:hypothetical protein [Bradyrhizobium sp.]|jgi:hypothetical protein|uniref:hypothetical protein n=1 Tax=Bradyrhizobium sp. TaxID=376 RepID=UPI002D2A6775|nr:hypothetical protein [Bradyrhizobium sp.]HZR75183.1 hypothetical protein [Bradyrhizobium sp.]